MRATKYVVQSCGIFARHRIVEAGDTFIPTIASSNCRFMSSDHASTISSKPIESAVTHYFAEGKYYDLRRECGYQTWVASPVLKWKFAVTLTSGSPSALLRFTGFIEDALVPKNYLGKQISCFEQEVLIKPSGRIELSPINSGGDVHEAKLIYSGLIMAADKVEVKGTFSSKVKLCKPGETKPCYEGWLSAETPAPGLFILAKKPYLNPSDMLPCRPFPLEPTEPNVPCLSYKLS